MVLIAYVVRLSPNIHIVIHLGYVTYIVFGLKHLLSYLICTSSEGSDQTMQMSSDSVPQYHYPHAFLKKRRGYCNHLRPSVTLSPPKPLDEIQPNLVCELLT